MNPNTFFYSLESKATIVSIITQQEQQHWRQPSRQSASVVVDKLFSHMFRAPILTTVVGNFAKHGLELKNQHDYSTSYDFYLEQLQSIKVVLSPPLDSYHHWEAICSCH
jgi:hypothetical protein